MDWPGAIIKQGISIGTGSVIGMGSIVTKDVEAYSIVAGCPAKVIRKRFNDDVIQHLKAIKWWELNDDLLFKYAEYFTVPQKFISKIQK